VGWDDYENRCYMQTSRKRRDQQTKSEMELTPDRLKKQTAEF
jgi:hypothetical protein